jgi:hypothetical protein
MSAGARWDQLTTKQRCYLLFKRLDANSRGVAKLGSAVWYLSYDLGLDVSQAAPELTVALRAVMRERRTLREALESELAAMWAEAAAGKALHIGGN